MTQTRVLLVEDNDLFRDSLRDMLKNAGLSVVGEARDGTRAVAMAGELKPDVVLMDLTLPRMDGYEAAPLIRRQVPEARIVGMSMHPREEVADLVKRSGYSDYVAKDAPWEEMMAVINGPSSSAPPSRR